MGEDLKAKRDYYRSKTLASPKKRRNERLVLDVDGEQIEYEIRAPSLKEDGAIAKATTKLVQRPGARQPDVEIDVAEQHVQAAIRCVYIPGTDQRVFEQSDAEALRNAPVGSWIETLAKATNKIRNVDPEEVAGNSETTQNG